MEDLKAVAFTDGGFKKSKQRLLRRMELERGYLRFNLRRPQCYRCRGGRQRHRLAVPGMVNNVVP